MSWNWRSSLHDLLRGGTFPPDQRLRHLADAVAAVRCVHQICWHNDIKPSNFLLVDGQLKVADFGIARPLDEKTSSTAWERSEPYAAPERFGPHPVVSKEGDVYSLAVLYHEVLVGHRPHLGQLSKKLTRKERSVLSKALEYERHRRPPLEELAGLLPLPTAAPLPPPPPRGDFVAPEDRMAFRRARHSVTLASETYARFLGAAMEDYPSADPEEVRPLVLGVLGGFDVTVFPTQEAVAAWQLARDIYRLVAGVAEDDASVVMLNGRHADASNEHIVGSHQAGTVTTNDVSKAWQRDVPGLIGPSTCGIILCNPVALQRSTLNPLREAFGEDRTVNVSGKLVELSNLLNVTTIYEDRPGRLEGGYIYRFGVGTELGVEGLSREAREILDDSYDDDDRGRIKVVVSPQRSPPSGRPWARSISPRIYEMRSGSASPIRPWRRV